MNNLPILCHFGQQVRQLNEQITIFPVYWSLSMIFDDSLSRKGTINNILPTVNPYIRTDQHFSYTNRILPKLPPEICDILFPM